MIELDRRSSLYIHTKCMALPRPILTTLEVSGDGRFWIPATAALLLTPLPLAGFSKLRWFCLNFFIGLIFDLILIGILKSLIKRPRPAYNKGMYLVLSVDHWSFPSGHASRACFIGSFFWLCLSVLQEIRVQLGFNPGVAQAVVVDPNLRLDDDGLIKAAIVIIMMWSIATSASRILLGRHFVLDVLAGAILGVLEAFIVYNLFFVSERFSEESYLWIAGNACRHETYLPVFVGSLCKGLNITRI